MQLKEMMGKGNHDLASHALFNLAMTLSRSRSSTITCLYRDLAPLSRFTLFLRTPRTYITMSVKRSVKVKNGLRY